MKKVLILAYDFPPYVSVGGLRPYSWLKYLKEFDVEPIVVTRQFSTSFGDARDYVAASESVIAIIDETAQGTVIRSPYKPNFANRLFLKFGDSKYRFIRKMYTAFFEVAQYFWICGPKKELYKAADAYLSANKVDAIIATGDPFVLFSFASKLSKRHGVEWIADYRDPWSHSKIGPFASLFIIINRAIEKKTVKSAVFLSTVSEVFKAKIGSLFRDKEIFILPNGYDPAVLDQISKISQNNQTLSISFVGTIYNWHPWKSVIKSFSNVLTLSPKIEMKLHFYGVNISEEIKSFVADLPCKTQLAIEIHPKCPNDKLLEKVANDNVVLLFNYYSFMGTKIYDYIGSKRKIILCYSNDKDALVLKEKYYPLESENGYDDEVQAKLINETNSGIVVEDEAHLHTVLWDLLDEFKATGQIACNSHGIENYSRKIQVKKLAELIKNLK